MGIKQRYQKLSKLLIEHGQEHLLAFYDRLDGQQQESLLSQIENLDFTKMPGWIRDYIKNSSPADLPKKFGPAEFYPSQPTAANVERYAKARKLGSELISGGKVAAFVVAGGQGTRLGFDGPKGNYPISPIKNKTLFEIFAETIQAASEKYETELNWYIMTSPLNYDATVQIFEGNDYYGLGKSRVFIFQQGTLPNFDVDGKILLADEATISKSPDGHGGSLKALYDSGAVADMKNKGIKYISYFQVDNPLINIFDPLFIGLHSEDGSEMSSKALIKAHPKEKLGNFCIVDGKVTVIEYSDLPDRLANKRNKDGSLVFESGSIAIHIISVSFVEKLNKDGFALPIHRAVKKIPYIDPQGRTVKPTEPNGVKLETFVFDALPLAEESMILQTIRSEEFGPVKNAKGEDSADVTRKMMTARAAGWLRDAGVMIPMDCDNQPDCVIEMAPSFALSREDVIEKAGQISQIQPGEQVYLS